VPGHHQVDGAIIINVGQNRARARGRTSQPRWPRPLGKCRVAVIPPEDIRVLARAEWGSRDEQIEIPVVIKIHKCQPSRLIQRTNAHR
jgi:hypothetical protein